MIKVFQIIMGMADYFRHPSYKTSWDGPFNGQLVRRQVFENILDKLSFDALVETGTFRGTTTSYLADYSSLPVYTVEFNQRFYGYSKMRFLLKPRVHCILDDSVKFLNDIKALPAFRDKQLFFYLDAHWNDHIPLREEVEIVFKNWKDSVIMIDDFEVPDDFGYHFDDYGNGNVLSLDYLNINAESDVFVFFPKATSEEESGSKRGWVVLTRSQSLAEKLESIEGLRKWKFKQLTQDRKTG